MKASQRVDIQGHVSAGFEAVGDAFAENFSRRRELGGACCVYHRGEKVVDLWGGVRNKSTGEPWHEDTMVLIWSATKGLAAMTLAVAHSRGWLDYEERVCTYWPEFAQQGKKRSPSANSWLTKRACSPSMSRWTRAWSPTSIVLRSSSLARNRLGSLARGRPIARSLSVSTKASCCAGSIRSIAAWDSSFRMRSPHRSGSTSTSGCRRTFQTRAWPRSPRRHGSSCCAAFRFASRWRH
jgi:Beta-lactamase